MLEDNKGTCMTLLKKYPPAGFKIKIAQHIVLNLSITTLFSYFIKPAGGFPIKSESCIGVGALC